jgi:hypothetical protein
MLHAGATICFLAVRSIHSLWSRTMQKIRAVARLACRSVNDGDLPMATIHGLCLEPGSRPGPSRAPAAAAPKIDASRLGFLDVADAAHPLAINTLYEAQAALLILKRSAGDCNPFIDEAADDCARGLIRTQCHCVTRELLVRHMRNALGWPTEASIGAVLQELMAEGWPVRLI